MENETSPLDIAGEIANQATQGAQERQAKRAAAEREANEWKRLEAAWGRAVGAFAPKDGYPESPCDCDKAEQALRELFPLIADRGWDTWIPDMIRNLDGKDISDFQAARFVLCLLQSVSNAESQPGTVAAMVQSALEGWRAVTLQEGVRTAWEFFKIRDSNNGEPWPTATAESADDSEPAENKAETVSRKQPPKLKNWAIGLADQGWRVFQWTLPQKAWRERGKIDLPRGRVTQLAQALAEHGGALSREEAIKTLAVSGTSSETVWRSRCQPARREFVKVVRRTIAEIAGSNSITEDPMPLDANGDGWRCEVAIGYAQRERDLAGKIRLAFKRREEIDAENEADQRGVT